MPRNLEKRWKIWAGLAFEDGSLIGETFTYEEAKKLASKKRRELGFKHSWAFLADEGRGVHITLGNIGVSASDWVYPTER